MKKGMLKAMIVIVGWLVTLEIVSGGMVLTAHAAERIVDISVSQKEWRQEENGKYYWYERGVRQGTRQDPKGVLGDGSVRGREIYDPESNGWYWLDACYNGAKATGKEVWMPYVYQGEEFFNAADLERIAANSGGLKQNVIDAVKSHCGKWVRYDAEGKMYTGWYAVIGEEAIRYPKQAGNIYYYDPVTGLMAKGPVCIDGVNYQFDLVSGALLSGGQISVKRVELKAKNMIPHRTYSAHEHELLSGDYTEYKYDARGNCITQITYDRNGFALGYERYEYDCFDRENKHFKCENGQEYLYVQKVYSPPFVSEIHYNVAGNQTFAIMMEYNSRDQVIREWKKDARDTVKTVTAYAYDNQGNKKEQRTYNGANELLDKVTYVFTKSGRREELVGYNSSAVVVSKEINEYDGNGRVTKTIGGQRMMVDGRSYWGESQHYYSYNQAGDRIRHAMYNGDLLESGTVSEYGNILVITD